MQIRTSSAVAIAALLLTAGSFSAAAQTTTGSKPVASKTKGIKTQGIKTQAKKGAVPKSPTTRPGATVAATTATATSSIAPAPTLAQQLNVALSFPPRAGLSVYSDDAFLLTRLGVTETLVRATASGEAQPLLATSWEQITSTTWRFTLRNGVMFHDGTSSMPRLS